MKVIISYIVEYILFSNIELVDYTKEYKWILGYNVLDYLFENLRIEVIKMFYKNSYVFKIILLQINVKVFN